MKCKINKTEMKPFMSFGKMPIANGFLNKEQFSDEFFFDMEVGFSEKLSLFQLKDHPSPQQMFNERYPFFTGSSSAMKEHFKEYAEFLKKSYIKNNSKIIEIGSNDGSFGSNFNDANVEYMGFEPSANVAEFATKNNNVKTLVEFFGTNTIDLIKHYKGKTDLIFAANVICHVPDLTDLIKAVDQLLSKNGVFIFEEPYMGAMFEKTSYDQIYDEHIFMFSASSVKSIFNLFNMELVDALRQKTHGGSVRYVVARKGTHKISKNVSLLLDYEKKNNFDNIESCRQFKKNCEDSKIRLNNLIDGFLSKGKSIAGYAATSKSTTVLNYCNIGPDKIKYICDTTKEKIGKFSPGMHIPILSSDHFKLKPPQIAYLFAWNHKVEIFDKEKNFTKNKGEWISHVEL